MSGALMDWRGTPIVIGDTVIYSAGANDSTQMVEAIVTGFGKADKVKLHILRSSSHGSMLNTQRPASRITIVEKLAPSGVPIREEVENAAKEKAKDAQFKRNTHRLVDSYEQPKKEDYPKSTSSPRWDWSPEYKSAYETWNKVDYQSKYGNCIECGATYTEQSKNVCP